jgi:hypothetical protein
MRYALVGLALLLSGCVYSTNVTNGGLVVRSNNLTGQVCELTNAGTWNCF